MLYLDILRLSAVAFVVCVGQTDGQTTSNTVKHMITKSFVLVTTKVYQQTNKPGRAMAAILVPAESNLVSIP